MMPALIIVCGLILVVILVFAWVRWRRRQGEAFFRRAVESFALQPGLEEQFLAAANATGKPRGLRWTSCELQGEPVFATGHTSHDVYGLNGATIGFAAIPGGDMEDVEAVGDIRYVTAVFVYRNNRWETDGRAIFNLEPAQALDRLGETTPLIG